MVSSERTYIAFLMIAFALLFWGLRLSTFHYDYLIFSLIAFPILFLGGMHMNKNLERFTGGTRSIDYFILPLIAAVVPLVYRAFKDFTLLNYTNLLSPVLITTVVLCLLSIFLVKPKKDKMIGFVLRVALVFSIYSYEAIVSVNCLLGDSNYSSYQTKVLEKQIKSKVRNGTRHHTYYLRILPRKNSFESIEINVEQLLYDETNVGDSLEVQMRKGYFGIPWLSFVKATPAR